MKSKRILITYLNNGDMKSTVAKEVMFNSIVDSLISKGLTNTKTTLEYHRKTARFDDGTMVYLMQFGTPAHGMRLTHIYFDEAIMSIPRGEEVINGAYLPFVVHGEYQNFDTSGQQVNLFSYINGELKIKEL